MRKFLENPAYTDFWSLQAVDKWLAAQPLTVPTLLEVGQWDQEDSYGAPAVYRALEPKDKNNDMVSLVIGPWRHSGANHYGYDLGALTFTGDTAREWRANYVKPFFDHWLKGGPDPHTPPVLTYATGINQWESSPSWPMGTADAYLPGGGRHGQFDQARSRRARRLRQRSGKAGAVHPAAHQHGRCRAVEAVAGARPALRVGSPRRRQLEDGAARQAGTHHGRARGGVVCLDHGHGQ